MGAYERLVDALRWETSAWHGRSMLRDLRNLVLLARTRGDGEVVAARLEGEFTAGDLRRVADAMDRALAAESPASDCNAMAEEQRRERRWR